MGFISGLLGTSNDYQASQQQQDFINQLKQQMAGNGPSVAQNQLKQGTDAANAGAASLIGSQRGINTGLQARQIADVTAANNQRMAGQAATLRAGEQLGTEGLLGGQIQSQEQLRAGVAGQNAQTNAGIVGGILGGAGAAIPKWRGGEIGYASGGLIDPVSYLGLPSGGAALRTGFSNLGAGIGTRMRMPTPMDEGAYQVGGGQTDQMDAGGEGGGGDYATGGPVPGRAAVAGDSPQNDKVPAMLSPGEVVLPRSVADDPEKAAAFVRAIRRKKAGTSYGAVLAAHRTLAAHYAEEGE